MFLWIRPLQKCISNATWKDVYNKYTAHTISSSELNINFVLFVLPSEKLEDMKNKSFVLKEGVEYKIKISFKVSQDNLFP